MTDILLAPLWLPGLFVRFGEGISQKNAVGRILHGIICQNWAAPMIEIQGQSFACYASPRVIVGRWGILSWRNWLCAWLAGEPTVQ